MGSNFTKLNWADLKSALVYAVLAALAALLVYVIGLGDLFLITFKPIVNIFGLSLAAGILSVIKHALTTSDNKFIGAVDLTPKK